MTYAPARQGLAAFGALILLVSASTAPAANSAVAPDGKARVDLKPVPAQAIGKNTINAALILASYAGWTIDVTTGLTGAVKVNSYDASWIGTLGGGVLTATYAQAGNIPAGSQLNWIQIIDTNIPLGGNSSPYIDPRPNDDTLPFYWTVPELGMANKGNATAKSVDFSDFSKRDESDLLTKDPITWTAMLYPVIWDQNKTVIVGDGIKWGWEMVSLPQAGVPEPGSWVMMIFGMGLAGGVLRRSRASSVGIRFLHG